MSAHDNTLKVGSNEMELVDFRVFKRVGEKVYEGIYGVNVSKVREIIRVPKLTELPGVPDFIEGIFDLRGVVIPVINLASWMGVASPENLDKKQQRVIIAEFNNILVGFVVDDAKRIRRINWNDIEPASFSSGYSGTHSLDGSKITGVTRIEGDAVLLILDLESVVQELGIYRPETNTEDGIPQFTGTVLIVDDSLTARKTVKQSLIKTGLKVIEAGDGQDALEKLDDLYNTYGENISQELRIIVSDVEMPRMDGFHFAAKAKEDVRFKRIPIVFNSSISDHFSERRGDAAGGEGYLVKFHADAFYKEIARIIALHENQ